MSLSPRSLTWELGRRGSQSPELVAQLCDAFRMELERKDLTKYVNTILTTHVVKSPPDHEAGLTVIQKLRGTPISCGINHFN